MNLLKTVIRNYSDTLVERAPIYSILGCELRYWHDFVKVIYRIDDPNAAYVQIYTFEDTVSTMRITYRVVQSNNGYVVLRYYRNENTPSLKTGEMSYDDLLWWLRYAILGDSHYYQYDRLYRECMAHQRKKEFFEDRDVIPHGFKTLK